MIIHLRKRDGMITLCGILLNGGQQIPVTEREWDCTCIPCKMANDGQ